MTDSTTIAGEQPSVAAVRSYLLDLQARITSAVAAVDGGSFLHDSWEKAPGEALQGNCITMIL